MTARRVIVAAGLLLAAAVPGAPGLAPGTAHAAAYRYWSYWHGDTGSWAYSGVGAASWRMRDGSVDGWRFVASEEGQAPRPGVAPEYAALCPEHPVEAPDVQVAVVVDMGTEPDAPAPRLRRSCLTLTTDRTGMRALYDAAAGAVRTRDGLVCGISGYPRAPECGEQVAQPRPTPSPSRPQPAPVNPAPSRVPAASRSPDGWAGASANPQRTGGAAPTATARPRSGATATPAGPGATPPLTQAPEPLASGLPPVAEPAGTDDSGAPVGVFVGLALLVALGGAAFVRARR